MGRGTQPSRAIWGKYTHLSFFPLALWPVVTSLLWLNLIQSQTTGREVDVGFQVSPWDTELCGEGVEWAADKGKDTPPAEMSGDTLEAKIGRSRLMIKNSGLNTHLNAFSASPWGGVNKS